MQRKKIGLVIGLVALIVGWWAFRPELLFIDQTVSETLAAATTGADSPVRLAEGQFRGYAH
jgi:hypothetical protein